MVETFEKKVGVIGSVQDLLFYSVSAQFTLLLW